MKKKEVHATNGFVNNLYYFQDEVLIDVLKSFIVINSPSSRSVGSVQRDPIQNNTKLWAVILLQDKIHIEWPDRERVVELFNKTGCCLLIVNLTFDGMRGKVHFQWQMKLKRGHSWHTHVNSRITGAT